MKFSKNKAQSNFVVPRCSLCSTPIHPAFLEYDLINPGFDKTLVLHLCDDCWKKYKEWKNDSGIS